MSRYSKINLYLQKNLSNYYENTDKENELVNSFSTLYSLAKSAQEQCEECSPKNLDMWRKAYLGTLGALTKTGEISTRKGRQLRKMLYELVESKVDNSIPMPKMQARDKSDIHLINITEQYLKYEVDRILTKYENDRSERSTYIDGTGWYKVSWDSLNNVHDRSGNVRLEFRTVDQVIPQPGVNDYKQLEYIFERSQVSVSKIYQMYNKIIQPLSETTNMVDVISCYYINDDGIYQASSKLVLSECPPRLYISPTLPFLTIKSTPIL